jgi:hypothetical protein
VLAAKKPMKLAVEQEDASNRLEWIRHNAHTRWIEEGRLDGHALRHWFEAEMAYNDSFRASPSK